VIRASLAQPLSPPTREATAAVILLLRSSKGYTLREGWYLLVRLRLESQQNIRRH
jgi:hypothetical protein